MDKSLISIRDFNPEDIDATGTLMYERPITIVESIPQQTAVSEDTSLEQDTSPPKYLAPKKIEVKRYILKK